MDVNQDERPAGEPKNSGVITGDETDKADEYCKDYIDFLNVAKTERETVSEAVSLAERRGFIPWRKGMKAEPGTKVYFNQRGRALVFCVFGKKPLADGLSIIASHADSPHLDLKMKPLYEESGAAYFDTHYYGMIKAYQWTGIPLALHGIVIRKDGKAITVCVGEDPGDPVLFIADLLPHLSREQMKRPANECVKNEDLDVLAGLRNFSGESGAGAVKRNVLAILQKKYGIDEDDFVSAELSVVPAFKARDMGLDRSMVGAYGQDDRSCAYASLTALLSLEKPCYSACAVFADKEETGSLGMTGMQSAFFGNFIGEIAGEAGIKAAAVFSNSLCLSADVNAAYDPRYDEVFDPRGEARLGGGAVLFRYWGEKGKEHTNDASAETAAVIRRILDGAGVIWQTGEGGRVDAGESGTISRFFAALDIPTIDLGVPILSMHSPFEAAAKTDIYMAHRAYAAFFGRS